MRNYREDGMYHAYNVLDLGENEVRVYRLYLTLEGQVKEEVLTRFGELGLAIRDGAVRRR